jgi:hypothetical protein
MSHHLARSVGAAASILQLSVPMISLTAAQGFGPRSAVASTYRIAVVHDRLTDSTRLSASFTASSQPFGLDSRAWLDLSFSFAGVRLIAAPAFVALTIESWTPGRGGWAFAHPQTRALMKNVIATLVPKVSCGGAPRAASPCADAL